MSLERDIRTLLRLEFNRRMENATPTERYHAISKAAAAAVEPTRTHPPKGKRVAYLSAEFLMGRLIFQNLFNMRQLQAVETLLNRHRVSLDTLEQIEDAALGNGGLGRLAACFLESAATVGIPLDGYGIRYRYGYFKQQLVNGFQTEQPDDWLRFGDPWSRRREAERVKITYGDGQEVWAVPYDTPVIGYGAHTVNTLRLWQAESPTPLDLDAFNAQQYDRATAARDAAERLSAVLYPNDTTPAGKVLRLKQQYFFAAASVQDILRRYYARYGRRYTHIESFAAIQLNDTHLVVAVLEFLRLLCADGLSFTKALNLARRVFSYTNHTVMPEALECWRLDLFEEYLPQLVPVLQKTHAALQRELRRQGITGAGAAAYWIVENRTVHMARLAIFTCHAINGVAALHTELLKTTVFPHWHKLYPTRFHSVTNGITPRRWLALANPELSALITRHIGGGWITDLSRLRELEPLQNDPAFLREFAAVKRQKKEQLVAFIRQKTGVAVSADCLFDIQAKRLHEYKRQLLNALSIADLYFSLKEGSLTDWHPTLFLFAAKAAPGYTRAKAVIKYITELGRLIAADPAVSGQIPVVFLPDYNVTAAEHLMPAADVSEQISAAGTEASGTGNMKFMLNGAVTLGTADGANIEIVERAEAQNNYIFGLTAAEIAARRADYDPAALAAENPRLRRALNTLIDGTLDDGGSGLFRELYDSLLKGTDWHRPDAYFLLADFDDYSRTRRRINRDYRNREAFTRKGVCNTAAAGWFSADRAVSEYAADIWGLPPHN